MYAMEIHDTHSDALRENTYINLQQPMSQFSDPVVFSISDLPTQHVQCILCKEALAGNKRFVIVLHEAIRQNSYYIHTLYHMNT